MTENLLVVGESGVAADFAEYVARRGGHGPADAPCAVVFLDGADWRTALAVGPRFGAACLVSTARVHFGDPVAARAEADAVQELRHRADRLTVFRSAPVLSPRSRLRAVLRRFAFLHPLVPGGLRGCAVDGEDLFAALVQELHDQERTRPRVLTLLGPNLPWRERLRAHQEPGLVSRVLTALAYLLSLLLLGPLAGLVVRLLARLRPRWRNLHLEALAPASAGELLALVNPYNHGHVKVVGYNNGVVHFGHRHPGRTLVTTVRCDHPVRVRPGAATFGAGVTIGRAVAALATSGQELYVLPNYSYVALGTAFFVPIHGSASEYSTLADTIERVLLYDPVVDHFRLLRRGEPEFRERLYDLGRPQLLLRLTLRVRPRAAYYRRRESWEQATPAALLTLLRDPGAVNVEVRKSRAAGSAVVVYRYYAAPPGDGGDTVALPRDALGGLWDRLEANPITSVLFHWAVRTFAHHVELFLTPGQFTIFWETHAALPLSKIQLRFLRPGDSPSPRLPAEAVSADLFMLKWHKETFDAYVLGTLGAVAHNPGKHSA